MLRLRNGVSSLNLAQGMQNSLDSKLSNAQAALESVKGGDASTECNKLDSFINAVHAQPRSVISKSQIVTRGSVR